LPLLTYLWYFSLDILETGLNYAHNFIKIRLVFHTPYLWNESGDPQFLFHFWNKQIVICRSRSLKKILSSRKFRMNVLKAFGPPETSATAKLCEMADGFFDCLNVQSKTEHVMKRKPFLAPYSSPKKVCFFSLNLDNSQQANWVGLSNCILLCLQSPWHFLCQ